MGSLLNLPAYIFALVGINGMRLRQPTRVAWSLGHSRPDHVRVRPLLAVALAPHV